VKTKRRQIHGDEEGKDSKNLQECKEHEYLKATWGSPLNQGSVTVRRFAEKDSAEVKAEDESELEEAGQPVATARVRRTLSN